MLGVLAVFHLKRYWVVHIFSLMRRKLIKKA
ncbi:hypothetical protein EMIT0P228_80020 [Pseudomonas brassicacearum]